MIKKGSKLGRKTNCCPTLFYDLSLSGAQSISVRQGPERAGDSTVSVLPSALPEDLLGPTQATSAFPVFMQHMPPTDGGFTYELTLSLIEMLGLKHVKEAIISYII